MKHAIKEETIDDSEENVNLPGLFGSADDQYEHTAKKIKTEIMDHDDIKPDERNLSFVVHHEEVYEGDIDPHEANKGDTNTHEHDAEFRCQRCIFIATKKASLDLHQIVHKPEKPLQCPLCGFKTYHITSFNTHILNHNCDQPYHCSSCTMCFFTSFLMYRHMKDKHPESMIKCDKCDFVTHSSTTMHTHKVNHTSGDVIYKQCNSCCFVATKAETLQLHNVIHTNHPNDKAPYTCTNCGYQEMDAHRFNKHIRYHTNDKLHKCPHCVKSFNREIEMSTHINRKHTQIRLSCDRCDFMASLSREIQKHKEKEHPVIMLECQRLQCGFITSKATVLDMHQIVHSAATYQCTMCKFDTKVASTFDTHLLVHFKDKPHKCPHCSGCYYTTRNLDAHMRRLHPDLILRCTKFYKSCSYTTYNPDKLEEHFVKCKFNRRKCKLERQKKKEKAVCQQCDFVLENIPDNLLIDRKTTYLCTSCQISQN